MKAQRNALIALVLSAVVVVGLAAAAAQADGGGAAVKAAEPMGIVWTHGNAGGHANPHKSPNLINHGGPVQHGTAVYPIYWGTSWRSAGDKVGGLDIFYGGVGGSAYAETNSEYYDSKGTVSSTLSFGTRNDLTDDSAAPAQAPSTTDVLNEVVKVVGAGNLVAGAYYPVYIDQPRGHARYCAWHSAGSVSTGRGTVEVQFGFFFKLDGDGGCDPQTPAGVNSYSEGAQALVNVSGHELSEMLTDPQLNAWYDISGEENADKCAWTFGPQPIPIGGVDWKIQGNWSNSSYDAGVGYVDNGSTDVGCIDGTNASAPR